MKVKRSGSGSSGRRQPKPGDRELFKRSEQEPPPNLKDIIARAIAGEPMAQVCYKLEKTHKKLLQRLCYDLSTLRGAKVSLTDAITEGLSLWVAHNFPETLGGAALQENA